MTDRPTVGEMKPPMGELVHLPKRRIKISKREKMVREFEFLIAEHFRRQNEQQVAMNKDLSDQVQRLTIGISRLVDEMQGVRTGKKEEAFARVGATDASPDLPTVSAEAALIYTQTAGEIGKILNFHATQIGLFLGSRGLGWAGNGDYQEPGRHKKDTQTKWWHHDVPVRLRKILDQGCPERIGISDKAVLAIFREWQARKEDERLLTESMANVKPH